MAAHPAKAEPARDTTSAQAQIAFFDAVERGRLREVEAFLAQGFGANDVQDYGFNVGDSPLMKAAQQGNAQMVKFLLRRHADVNYRNANANDGETALLRAAKFAGPGGISDTHAIDFRQTLALLLKAGANPDTPDRNGGLPLFFAPTTWVIQALLAAGADPNAASSNPPLIEHAHDPARVRLLLAAGARPDVRDAQGASALAVAAEKGSLESVRQLLAVMSSDAVRGADADGHNALDAAARGGDAGIVRLLLAQGLPATERAVRAAATQGHLQAARLLQRAMDPPQWPSLEAGAPAEARVYLLILQKRPQEALAAYRALETVACGRMTPLASAVDAGNVEAVRALLALGVDVNHQTPAPLRSELVPQPQTSSGLPRLVHVLPPPCNDASLAPQAALPTLPQATQPVGRLPFAPAPGTESALPPAGFWTDNALMRAVARNHLEIARLLVAAGANPALQSHYPPHASAQAWLQARPPSHGASLAAWKKLLKLGRP
ncbi:ankyrin repeat protein [Variovorax boronicumulans]|uniref:Ankyrin repeat protein n=1 Tax=Variovorax boronicumulans TaxID=436515 RepID=A0AAW8DPA6_9BURK|nr:ankyrin repeat domain-containing protein [Variovorax boronicumulans]MDP9876016.1 ankyrin repeat protein [Variovorax boronicumulans]MDP9921300.1 ankyrin repeat protein [Variovorax boronicumulans]